MDGGGDIIINLLILYNACFSLLSLTVKIKKLYRTDIFIKCTSIDSARSVEGYYLGYFYFRISMPKEWFFCIHETNILFIIVIVFIVFIIYWFMCYLSDTRMKKQLLY